MKQNLKYYISTRCRAVAAAAMLVVCLIIITFYAVNRDTSDAMLSVDDTPETQTVLYGEWIGKNGKILKINREGENYYLYNGAKKQKNDVSTCTKTELPIEFDYSCKTADNSILNSEDKKYNEFAGKNVYRGSKQSIQSYISYLQQKEGYTILCYIKDSSVWDGYLKDSSGKIHRMMYIDQFDQKQCILITAELDSADAIPKDLQNYT